MIIRTIQWGVSLFFAVAAVRLATALVGVWRPDAPGDKRRDGRWLFGWLVLLSVALALVHCEAGSFYGFQDPSGGDWSFDAHGWPLAEPRGLFDLSGNGPTVEAIYWMAMVVDLLCSLALLAGTQLVVDRWLAAWDAPARWPALRREAAGWLAALLAVLACERLALRPLTLPGSELIVYSTLVYETAEVRAGMLIGLTCLVFLIGLAIARGIGTVRALYAEGVI
ncbi:MAG TPA: hypothetical protein VNH11_29765 [Pirellulales bacterium]|nr:hypothetical protein [Pirellulales bacterium]